MATFPTPTYVGQTTVVGSTTYVWNGYAWVVQSSGGTSTLANLTITSTLIVTSSTNSTSTTTGALQVTGGVSVGGNINVSGNLVVSGTISATSGIVGVSGNNISQNQTSVYAIDTGTTHQVVVTVNANTTTVFLPNETDFYSKVKILSNTTATSTTTASLVVTGGVGIGGDLYVGGNVVAPNLRLVDAMFTSNEITLNTAATAVLDIYDSTQFRSAKYLVQIDSYNTGTTATFQVTELLMLVDNDAKVHITEYASVYNYDQNVYGELGSFSGDVQMDNMVRFYFTPTVASPKVISVIRTALVV